MAKIVTLNELIEYFNNFAQNHLQIQQFGYGDTSLLSRSKSSSYPLMWTHRTNSSSIEVSSNRNQVPVHSFSVLFLDRIVTIDNDEQGFESENTSEILSDQFQIAQDFIDYLLKNLNSYGVNLSEQSVTLDEIYDETVDKVAGWQVNFELRCIQHNCSTPLLPISNARNLCAVGTVKNSDDTYTNTVVSGGTLTLSDITLSINGVTQSTYPSAVNISATYSAPSPTTIVYQRPEWTGQSTSYADYDTGYNYQNGSYDYNPPAGVVQQLDLTQGFTKLKNNNIHGNKERFTDENGLQVYGSNVVVDHLTGLMWEKTYASYGNWNNTIPNVPNINTGGYDDWRIPMITEYNSLADWGLATGGLYYSPFLLNASSGNPFFISGESGRNSAYTPIFYFNASNLTGAQQTVLISRTAKSNPSGAVAMHCRTHLS